MTPSTGDFPPRIENDSLSIAADPRCVFTTRRCDHSSPSSLDEYFGQGGVVLNLTLALSAPVVHGRSRVSAMSADADLQTIQNRKLVP